MGKDIHDYIPRTWASIHCRSNMKKKNLQLGEVHDRIPIPK